MRFRPCSIIAVTVALSAGSAFAAEDIDPVFGLHYDAKKVHFEHASPGLMAQCTALQNDHWDRDLYVYATDGEYAILAGRFTPKNNNPRPSMTDKLGAVVHLADGQCEPVGPARETLDTSGDLLSDATRSALAKDAVVRYSAAYGSRAAFDAARARQHISVTHSAVLTQALSPEHP